MIGHRNFVDLKTGSVYKEPTINGLTKSEMIIEIKKLKLKEQNEEKLCHAIRHDKCMVEFWLYDEKEAEKLKKLGFRVNTSFNMGGGKSAIIVW